MRGIAAYCLNIGTVVLTSTEAVTAVCTFSEPAMQTSIDV